MLHVLIADDEHLARTRLRKMLSPYQASERLIIVDEASDGDEALLKLRMHHVDLLFLDIRMPELDGFGVLERLDPKHRPIVVFTTAFDEYALQAFQSNAVHYLLKPINQQELDAAILRAEQIKKQDTSALDQEKVNKLLDWIENQGETLTLKSEETPRYLSHISVPNRDRFLVFPIQQLVSIEVVDNVTHFFFAPEEPTSPLSLVRYRVPYSLDDLEDKLDPNIFLRVHRGAIINLYHIKEIITWFSGRYKILLYANHEVIASRERSRLLKKRLIL